MKFCKNKGTALNILIPTLIVIFITFILTVFTSFHLLFGVLTIIILFLTVPILLFLDPISLLYYVEFDQNGFRILFCKKVKKIISWDEIQKIIIVNPFRCGENFEIKLKDNEKVLIHKSSKIELAINLFYNDKKKPQ